MMKELNHINFDEWLLSYFDGALSPAETKHFMEFVNQNPSLKESLDLMDVSLVSATNIEVPKGLEKHFMKMKWYAQPWVKAVLIASGVSIALTALLLLNKEKEKNPNTKPQHINVESNKTIIEAPTSVLPEEKEDIRKDFPMEHSSSAVNPKKENKLTEDEKNVVDQNTTKSPIDPINIAPEIKAEKEETKEILPSPMENKIEKNDAEVNKKKNLKIKKKPQEALDSQLQ